MDWSGPVRQVAGRGWGWAAAVFAAGTIAAGAGATIRWVPDGPGGRTGVVRVEGLSQDQLRAFRTSSVEPQVLSLYAELPGETSVVGATPMAGTYEVGRRSVAFRPGFPLDFGMRYRAVFRPQRAPGSSAGLGAVVSTVFRLPEPPVGVPTRVTQIYPSASVLPENLLKFYLHFSGPMSGGHIYEHIHLKDAGGRPVELPFLEIDEELWDRPMTRLTLFIDPGRIKRGVQPLEEIGPALESGKEFTLVIDREWADAAGRPLREGFEKRFRVGPADRTPPDPGAWQVGVPPAGTRRPLVVGFQESMDHALAERVIGVTDSRGRPVQGAVRLGAEERQWEFAPERPWKRGQYVLVVQRKLEDLAGNNIGKPFEVDTFDRVDRRMTDTPVRLPFGVGD